MQQLQLQTAWHKALAAQDRKNIEKIFAETKDVNNNNFIFSPIREAINHKEELLVTVLIHNFMEHPLTFENSRLTYKIEGEIIAEKTFNLPTLIIPNKVSMPWTFIFPKDSYVLQSSFESGRLEIFNV